MFPPPIQAVCSTWYFSIGTLIDFPEYPASWLPNFFWLEIISFIGEESVQATHLAWKRDVSKNA